MVEVKHRGKDTLIRGFCSRFYLSWLVSSPNLTRGFTTVSGLALGRRIIRYIFNYTSCQKFIKKVNYAWLGIIFFICDQKIFFLWYGDHIIFDLSIILFLIWSLMLGSNYLWFWQRSYYLYCVSGSYNIYSLNDHTDMRLWFEKLRS